MKVQIFQNGNGKFKVKVPTIQRELRSKWLVFFKFVEVEQMVELPKLFSSLEEAKNAAYRHSDEYTEKANEWKLVQ